jgi:hypothetical protein
VKSVSPSETGAVHHGSQERFTKEDRRQTTLGPQRRRAEIDRAGSEEVRSSRRKEGVGPQVGEESSGQKGQDQTTGTRATVLVGFVQVDS